jgi:Bacteriophage lambda head decoration protein D
MVKFFQEGAHPAEFVLHEQDGHLSRENLTIGADQNFPPGTVLALAAGNYTAIELDAIPAAGTAVAIALYGAVTGAGETAKIAGLVRLAEVNGNCLSWPTGTTEANQAAIVALLEAQNVIVRGLPAAA